MTDNLLCPVLGHTSRHPYPKMYTETGYFLGVLSSVMDRWNRTNVKTIDYVTVGLLMFRPWSCQGGTSSHPMGGRKHVRTHTYTHSGTLPSKYPDFSWSNGFKVSRDYNEVLTIPSDIPEWNMHACF